MLMKAHGDVFPTAMKDISMRGERSVDVACGPLTDQGERKQMYALKASLPHVSRCVANVQQSWSRLTFSS